MVNFLNAKGQTTSEPRHVNIKKSGTLSQTPSYSTTMRALRYLPAERWERWFQFYCPEVLKDTFVVRAQRAGPQQLKRDCLHRWKIWMHHWTRNAKA